MAIVFAALVPHPPEALSQIGGDQTTKLKTTINALQQLEQDLYVAKPDSILIISPHGQILPDAITIHFAENFQIDFQQFGDLKTKMDLAGDLALSYLLRERCETSFPLHAVADTRLDYGAAVPLYFLAQHLKNVRLIDIHPSLLPLAQHFLFGQKIQGQLKETNNRIAIIASGDLSHRHLPQSPGGFTPEAKLFDEEVTNLLKENKVQDLLNLAPEKRKLVGECGLGSLAILLGILDGTKYSTEVLSYEAPLGVGCLTTQFRLL